MAQREEKRNLETIPVGSLGMIPLEGCRALGEKVDNYLVKWIVYGYERYGQDLYRQDFCQSDKLSITSCGRFSLRRMRGMPFVGKRQQYGYT